LLPDIMGCLGTILIIVVYFLLQTRKITSEGLWYSLLNLIGALFILISLLYSWNLAAVLMEIAWVLISLFGIVRVFYKPEN
jgi:hypothetical protein